MGPWTKHPLIYEINTWVWLHDLSQVYRRPFTIGSVPAEEWELQQLVQLVGRSELRAGAWRLCDSSGWPDNLSHRHLLAWCWRSHADGYLIVVNYSESPAQGRIQLDWDDLHGALCRLHDHFSGAVHERDGAEMLHPGLYVNLPPWGFHFFELRAR